MNDILPRRLLFVFIFRWVAGAKEREYPSLGVAQWSWVLATNDSRRAEYSDLKANDEKCYHSVESNPQCELHVAARQKGFRHNRRNTSGKMEQTVNQRNRTDSNPVC